MSFNIALGITNLSNVLKFYIKLIHCFNKSFGKKSSQLNLLVHIIWNNTLNCIEIGHLSPSGSNIFALIFKIDLLVVGNENASFTNSSK